MPLCIRCGTTRIPRKPPSRRGRQRIVCEPCQNLKPSTEPKPTHCTHCGLALQHEQGKWSQYCSRQCRQARSIQQRKAEGRPTTYHKPKPPRDLVCTVCGETFSQGGRGSNRLVCYADACVTAKRRADLRAFHERRMADGRQAALNDKRRKHEPRPCTDCGTTIRIGYRCRPCAQMLRRAIGRTSEQTRQRQAIFVRDDWTCQLCGDPIDPELMYPDPMSASIDHIIPLRECLEHFGPDYVDGPENWQAAHFLCNQKKGARLAS